MSLVRVVIESVSQKPEQSNPEQSNPEKSKPEQSNPEPPQGVDAVSSHGGKAQEEREAAMKDFKFGRADVLIATDVAAKVCIIRPRHPIPYTPLLSKVCIVRPRHATSDRWCGRCWAVTISG